MILTAASNQQTSFTNSTLSTHDYENMLLQEDSYQNRFHDFPISKNIKNNNNNNELYTNNNILNRDNYMEKMQNFNGQDQIENFKPLQQHMNGDSNSSQLDEQRALQLSLELSMLGLTTEEEAGANFNDIRMKKSMNMTECVPVPSSEHVAEIVGRQGCKIKALRAKTNTYIKTPVRGEEPVFVVTGRKEDVALAKREILQAAEHFSQIRASRRNSQSLSPLGSPTLTAPGHVTKQVRVPYRVVGLVVGPKGSTIKRIQQATNTYIVTPSRDKEPVFEVTGLPENVDRAKKEVEQHIALRTGGIIDPTHPESSEHFLNGFSSGLFSPTSSSAGGFNSFMDNNGLGNHLNDRSQSLDTFSYLSGHSSGSSKFSDLGSTTNSPFSGNAFYYDNLIPSPTTELEQLNNQFDPTPGSPAASFWPDVAPRNGMNRTIGSHAVTSVRSLSLSHANDSGRTSPPAHLRRLLGETGSDAFVSLPSTSTRLNGVNLGVNSFANSNESILSSIHSKLGTSDGESETSSPDWLTEKQTNLAAAVLKKQCYVCSESKIVAALVPCGHNLFCMECAERVKDSKGDCPACQKKVEAVLRIIS